jgi:hypothetical protein
MSSTEIYSALKNSIRQANTRLNINDDIVAYFPHAWTAEPQKQPLLSNKRTQQYNEIRF